MKKTIIIIWLFLFSLPSFSYTWIPFCPDTIHANNICFGVGSWKGVICTDEGMYLWQEDIEEWSFYTYGLPVMGAVHFNATQILVAMGCGTYSDGVYTFDLETKQFEVVEWLINPNFLIVVPVLDKQSNQFTDEYYIGCQFGGLYRSTDGLTWMEVPYFTGKSCTVMNFYENHLVVIEVSNIYNIYWSDDYGVTWQESTGSIPMITDLEFSYDGDLYGIFPSYSNSSGLYSSNDFGQTWDLEFWSDNMSAVGFDAMGTIFVGWESEQGIAIYDPLTPPPGLTFLNDGLPNININKILLNPAMSAIAIFCCTDAGVYMSNDYMVGGEEKMVNSDQISIYPNPVSKKRKVNVEISDNQDVMSFQIYSNDGRFVLEKNFNMNIVENRFDINLQGLEPGMYIIRIKTDNSEFAKKLVIH
ncbi:MAG: T9SS type A sorting domain-containing protein [Bacteroidales bacterium]|nr:T9SS type A sorting domain-containing protein [Bacteroidales bacterium]